MKVAFKNFNTGKKIIIGALLLAIISLFLPWGNYDGKNVSGIIFGSYILLALFLYPLIVLFLNKNLSKPIALFTAIVGIIVLIQIRAVEMLEIDGTMIRPTGIGLYVFIFSLLILMLGINIYKVDPENNNIKQKK